MFGQPDDSISYLFSKILCEHVEEPEQVNSKEIWRDMVQTPRYQTGSGPDDKPPILSGMYLRIKKDTIPYTNKNWAIHSGLHGKRYQRKRDATS